MTRTTIDFGIDLGTTNSAIAVLNGVSADIIKNNENMETTPSAVWIDGKNRLYVGQRAKDRIESDPHNAVAEFKRKMGTNDPFTFQRSGRVLSPQQLSAEVLKELKKNVQQRLAEEIVAAVITVPADFEQPQINATMEAARLAGLNQSPLLQEPIAAALAYGFQSKSEKTFWFVYDLGGGTFDATIIQFHDGMFHTVNHGGDKFLGGKDIDWAIIDKLFVPSICRDLNLEDFRPGNPVWRGAFAKLKIEAEKAKIRLSNEDSTTIYIDNLLPQHDYDFEFELRRSELVPLAEPYIRRTVEVSKRVVREANISPADIEKIVLVGGPTLAPYLRDMLGDPQTGLGIPVEYSIDPFTAVAQGAAIFAGTQRLDTTTSAATLPNQITIQLEYQPIGSDPEPYVGGKLVCPDISDFSQYAIEFKKTNGASQGWSSGKVPLGQNGSFTTSLHAEGNIQNLYAIAVYGPTGKAISASPSELKYTIGNVSSSQDLPHSVGVALANNEVVRFFQKGTSLPARGIEKLRTTIDLRKGASGEVLNIPVIEGENLRANRNREVGRLQISGDTIRRDIPIGSEVEVTVSMDQSRDLIVRAYLPILDEEYEQILHLGSNIPDSETLAMEFEKEKNRIEKLITDSEETQDSASRARLDALAAGEEFNRINVLLHNNPNDPETRNECQQRILDLRIKVDTIEDDLKWPTMVATARQELDILNTVVEEFGNDKIKQIQSSLEVEVNRAIEKHQPEYLERKTAEVTDFRFAILRAQPEFWINGIAFMEENKPRMVDQALANKWLAEAHDAYQARDIQRIRIAVQELAGLLPDDEQHLYDSGLGSTLMR